MATRIAMKHKDTGIMKDGYYGFSWTTFFFNFFPALFRGDFITFIGGFVISVIIAIITLGFGAFFINLVWAFMYNKYYTRRLFEQGYALAGSEGDNALAASALGVVTFRTTAADKIETTTDKSSNTIITNSTIDAATAPRTEQKQDIQPVIAGDDKPISKKAFCPECGAAIEPDHAFCGECGGKL